MQHKLLTKEHLNALSKFTIHSQDGKGFQARVLVKFFHPLSRYTLYVTEAEKQEDDILLFGYCISPQGSDGDEWGYSSFNEIANTRVRGLKTERDSFVGIGEYTLEGLLKLDGHLVEKT